MALVDSPIINQAIAGARTLPGLIDRLKAVSPEAAKQLTSKPLLLAKSPPVIIVTMILSALSARYGFGWDDDTTFFVSAACVAVASYVMRSITKQATSGLVTVKPPAVAEDAAAAPPTA